MKSIWKVGVLAVLALGVSGAGCDKKEGDGAPKAADQAAAGQEAAKQAAQQAGAAAQQAEAAVESAKAEAEKAKAELEAAKAEAEKAVAEAVNEAVKEAEVAAQVAAAGDGGAGGAGEAGKPADDVPPGLEPPPDVAAVPADAEKSGSGLAWKVLQPGTGANKPSAEDKVTVNYTGWTTDGKAFDSTIPRKQPLTLPLNGVIKGWTEGVQMMTVGEKRRFWIPPDLAYGETPMHPGAPSGLLVFDIELVSFEASPTVEVPADVSAAPADAQRTASGLAYKQLQPGSSDRKPQATDTVKVHYSGWTTDGKRFDSSVVRGQPATFPLNRVIAGWTEGLQLMSLGEKTRFWIPADLAYGETPSRPGAPAGMLVFDVELLEILSTP